MESSETVTIEQCEKILRNYLGHQQFKDGTYKVTPISKLDGFIGKQHHLWISYETDLRRDTKRFFLKTLNESNPVMLKLSKEIKAYEKEAFFYETLVPVLFSKDIYLGDIVPKCYLCEDDIIVLEDLATASYRTAIKNESLDVHHCKRCLETLAKFHAYPIIFEILKSRELGRCYYLTEDYGDILDDKVFTEEGSGASQFFQYSIEGLYNLIDILPERTIDKEVFIEKLQEMLNIMMSAKNGSSCRQTVLHGDLWGNNFMFKYGEEGIEDCKLIDFQTVKYGPLAFDLLQFVMTNTRRSMRKEHESDLLQHYYDYFSKLLTRQGFRPDEILTEREFADACNIFRLPAKIQAVVDRSITLIPEEKYLEASKSEEAFSKFIFEERSKYMVEAFNSSSTYRDIMTEDIIELNEMLIE
ncbi:unnamed protein product [Callosobruchus maculatus]|uniref:CHK kinase-like domain-containing protein n=1 Tax=Callosobruchus maculatus TaxID=64391 RepID=A0A653BVR9_CALMS|nr:unnamed protein product [Callosobruchus maculatus]